MILLYCVSGSFIFVLGLAIGMIFTTICHRKFTNAAWNAVKCMAEQNYELVTTLKEGFKEDFTDEGEEWKNR